MALDQNTIKKIAALSRLELKEERIAAMQQELNRILQFIDQLNLVDTSHIEAMTSVNLPAMPFRKDVINDGNYSEKILKGAPEVACDMFVVPKVVE